MNVHKRMRDGSLFSAERQRDIEGFAEEAGKTPAAFLSVLLCAAAFFQPSARHTHHS